MFRFMLVSSLFISIVSAGCLLSGCSAEDQSAEASVQTGSVELPLVSSANGHTYRLTSGYLIVYGSSTAYVDLSVDAPSVSVSLPTGQYSAYLNWPVLTRDDGTGNFVPVQATLVSSNSVSFDVFAGTTSTIAFTFQTDGALVRVGSGGLDVRVDVNEGSAVCTPFTDDCGEGSWCPPTELTGVPRACIAAGAVPVGEACSSPRDCVADSSCFDAGSGSVCLALCPSTLFGEQCSDGTVCEAAGSEYGVCRPASEGNE